MIVTAHATEGALAPLSGPVKAYRNIAPILGEPAATYEIPARTFAPTDSLDLADLPPGADTLIAGGAVYRITDAVPLTTTATRVSVRLDPFNTAMMNVGGFAPIVSGTLDAVGWTGAPPIDPARVAPRYPEPSRLVGAQAATSYRLFAVYENRVEGGGALRTQFLTIATKPLTTARLAAPLREFAPLVAELYSATGVTDGLATVNGLVLSGLWVIPDIFGEALDPVGEVALVTPTNPDGVPVDKIWTKELFVVARQRVPDTTNVLRFGNRNAYLDVPQLPPGVVQHVDVVLAIPPTGELTLTAYAADGGSVDLTPSLALPFPINNDNASKLQRGIADAVTLAGSAGTLVAGVLTGNPLAIGGALLSGASNVGGMVTRQTTNTAAQGSGLQNIVIPRTTDTGDTELFPIAGVAWLYYEAPLYGLEPYIWPYSHVVTNQVFNISVEGASESFIRGDLDCVNLPIAHRPLAREDLARGVLFDVREES